MSRVAVVVVLCSALLQATDSEKPRVTRASVEAVERSFDGRIEKAALSDPFELLGNTRGLYLAGYGAVFTAEVNLIITPSLNPFRREITNQEKASIRTRKLQQLGTLKKQMREMLVSTASLLDGIPATEQIVLGVSLFYNHWEDRRDLPAQVVMQAARRQLMDRSTAESAIRVEEW